MDVYSRFADVLLDRLAGTSIQAIALIGAVWLLCRWLPRWSPAMRCLLWWLVGAQLVLGLALGRPLELPLLAPDTAAVTASDDGADAHLAAFHPAHVDQAPFVSAPSAVTSHATPAAPPAPWPWRETLAAMWLLAMAAQAVAALREWRETRAVIRAAEPIDDPALLAQCAEQARELGLRRCPAVRRSDVIVSPQVAGLWRPVVLLPAERTLDPRECAMAMAHELAHVRRGDLWLGWIPALAQRAFFFHPLARWAMREYAFHREAACDAHVLDRSRAEPQDYGRLLLRLGVAFPVASGLAGASPTFQNLKRRLTLLQQTDRVPARFGAWLLVALVALAGALPYRVTARATDMDANAYDANAMIGEQQTGGTPAAAPVATAQSDAPPRPKPVAAAVDDAAPAATPQPAPVVARSPIPAVTARPAPAVASSPTPAAAAKPAARGMAALAAKPAPLPSPMAPPAPIAVPPAPDAPPAPPAPSAPSAPPAPPAPPSPVRIGHATHVDVDIQADAPRGFAIIEPDFITLQGNERDLAAARALQNGQEPLLWIRRGDAAYVVRDRTLLQRAQDAYAPMRDMSRLQGDLAGRQGELAGRQGGLAARGSALSMRRVELDSERRAIAAERQKLRPAPQGAAEEAAVARSFDDRLEAIDRQVADLDRQQADIHREEAELQKLQSSLSREQADASRHERDISRQVDGQLGRLIDEAVAAGLAQPAKRL